MRHGFTKMTAITKRFIYHRKRRVGLSCRMKDNCLLLEPRPSGGGPSENEEKRIYKAGFISERKFQSEIYDSRRVLLQWNIKNQKREKNQLKIPSWESFMSDICRTNSKLKFHLFILMTFIEWNFIKTNNKTYFVKCHCFL